MNRITGTWIEGAGERERERYFIYYYSVPVNRKHLSGSILLRTFCRFGDHAVSANDLVYSSVLFIVTVNSNAISCYFFYFLHRAALIDSGRAKQASTLRYVSSLMQV